MRIGLVLEAPFPEFGERNLSGLPFVGGKLSVLLGGEQRGVRGVLVVGHSFAATGSPAPGCCHPLEQIGAQRRE